MKPIPATTDLCRPWSVNWTNSFETLPEGISLGASQSSKMYLWRYFKQNSFNIWIFLVYFEFCIIYAHMLNNKKIVLFQIIDIIYGLHHVYYSKVNIKSKQFYVVKFVKYYTHKKIIKSIHIPISHKNFNIEFKKMLPNFYSSSKTFIQPSRAMIAKFMIIKYRINIKFLHISSFIWKFLRFFWNSVGLRYDILF